MCNMIEGISLKSITLSIGPDFPLCHTTLTIDRYLELGGKYKRLSTYKLSSVSKLKANATNTSMNS